MVLKHALVDTPQRVAGLAAASLNKVDMTSNATSDHMLDQVDYASVTTVLRQFEETDKSSRHYCHLTSSVSMNSTGRFNNRSQNSQRGRLMPEHIQRAKNLNACVKYGKPGH